MTGSRMGWVVAPTPVINSLIDLATNTTYGVPGYIQDAALFALQQGQALERKVAEPFRRRRDLLLEVLNKQDFITAIPAKGAMYLMLDVRKTGMSGEAFANALLDAHHIAVMPGESFGASSAGHIRLALTIEDDRLVGAVQTLCDFAQSLAKTTA
jgi:arginine:pyruvate transaminase